MAKKLPFLARRIAQLREAAGLNSLALATKAGIDPGFLWHIEKGSKQPGWDTIQQLADALGVQVDDLREKKSPEKT